MNSNQEITKELVLAAIQNGLVKQVFIPDSSDAEINKATAESIAEVYNTIFNSVKKTHQP